MTDPNRTNAEPPAVELAKVNFSYNGLPVLENVTFTIPQKQLTYIVGPNGGGKTTLLKLILGLLKPDSGEIRVFGKPPEETRSLVGYAPQQMNFDPLFPVTALDVVLMGRLRVRGGGRFSREDRRYAREALQALGVADLADRPFAELSGGQRQRVLIARSLSDRPRLLLLDEPTANVDAHTEDKLLETITNLAREMTILMVSHDLTFTARNVKTVLCVNRQVQEHPTGDITRDAIRKLYDHEMRLIRHDIKR